ncbi:MAG: UDP-N-acetylmuramate--alanine ligase [Legionella sp.]|nr:MAG: UDP-N-acetylmuramate--alanine ligase [Legionella sp.]
MNIEKLFSYGTLQYETVQIANFGRILEGSKDQLPGFELSMLKITDPIVIATSGETYHPIISYTGQATNFVEGMVFDINEEELKRADSYEVSDYKRIKVALSSGISAWVYVNNTTEANE